MSLVPPLAGMMAGAIEIATLWPLEWAKVQAQLHRGDPNFSVLAHARKTGLALYRGLPPLLIGAPLQCAVRFSALEACRASLAAPELVGRVPRSTDLVAGVLAGAVEAALVVTPMETVKTRLVDSNKGLVRGVRDILAAEGPSGVYKGLGPTVVKSASNQALRFVIYGEYKRRVSPDGSPLSAVQALGGGMVAGWLGAIGNTPVCVPACACHRSNPKRAPRGPSSEARRRHVRDHLGCAPPHSRWTWSRRGCRAWAPSGTARLSIAL